MIVEDVIRHLRSQEASLRCREVVRLLESVRFNVRDGSLGGHKIVTHPALGRLGWYGSNFNCGHSENAVVRSAYIRKLRRVLEQYKDEIAAYMGQE